MTFPNGWGLSILRNVKGLYAFSDFETCRLHDDIQVDGSIATHETIADLQREIDEVAGL